MSKDDHESIIVEKTMDTTGRLEVRQREDSEAPADEICSLQSELLTWISSRGEPTPQPVKVMVRTKTSLNNHTIRN